MYSDNVSGSLSYPTRNYGQVKVIDPTSRRKNFLMSLYLAVFGPVTVISEPVGKLWRLTARSDYRIEPIAVGEREWK